MKKRDDFFRRINMIFFKSNKKYSQFLEDYIDLYKDMQYILNSFSEAAVNTFDKNHINKINFQLMTPLSPKTYERICNKNITNPLLITIMEICIGLQLSTIESMNLIKLGGYSLNNSPIDIAYMIFLRNSKRFTIEDFILIMRNLNLFRI